METIRVTKKQLTDLYAKHGSISKVAEEVGCSTMTLRKVFEEAKIEVRKRAKIELVG